jgi:hypothetical protein
MATSRQRSGRTGKNPTARASSYDAAKEFEGQRYTGMKVGRSHKWYYAEGEWRERKVTPDDWTFTYEVHKRRAGKAPEGSGAPVGTEYHWYILADQIVRKLDANTYSTSMNGLKVKLAHKRANSDKWSATDAAQRRHLIAVLKQMLLRLEGDALVAAAPANGDHAKARKAKPGKRAKAEPPGVANQR